MKKEKKKSLLIILLSVIGTILILLGIIQGIMFSDRIILSFQSEEEMNIRGTLYLENGESATVKNGKANLVWQDFEPGILTLNIYYLGTEYPLYFELNQEMIDNREGQFTIEKYQIEDLTKDIEDFNLEKEDNEIIDLINKERIAKGLSKLEKNQRLSKVVSEISDTFFNQKLTEQEILDLTADKLIKEKSFIYGTDNYWYFYYINSSMNLSQEFYNSLYNNSYYYEIFMSEEITDIGVKTICDLEKYCLTLAIVSQNKITIEDYLRNNYLTYWDIYYILEQNEILLDYETNVTIKFNSTDYAKVYLVDSEKDYDKIVDRRSVNEIFLEKGRSFERNVTIKPNNCLVIWASSGEIDYNLTISEQ